MLESMEKLIDRLDLIPPGSTVLCAVSGGGDSICMLHALYRLRPRLGFTLLAAHYNHTLRGAESDRDADFVAQFMKLHCGPQRRPDGTLLPAVPLFSGIGDVRSEALRRGTGLEETARDMRYAYLRQVAQLTGAHRIATAHTADDNAETILFHLTRGTGLRGLTGIRPARDDLIRPLLTTTRKEVDQYLQFHALPYMEDHTNTDLTYSRNRIRHQVVPVLDGIFPGFAARTADMADRLREDEVFLSEQAQAISRQAQSRPDGLYLPAALIADAPRPLAVRAVRQLIGTLNGGDQDCSAAHLEAVLRLCQSSDPSAQVHLPYGLTARREYGGLLLTLQPEAPALEEGTLPLPGTADAGPWHITCESALYEGQDQQPFEFWLRQDAVSALTFRSRAVGDTLKLPGRPSKTLKKWSIDLKIPASARALLPVLICDGRVAAAAGLGPAEELLPRTGDPVWHIRIQSGSN